VINFKDYGLDTAYLKTKKAIQPKSSKMIFIVSLLEISN